MVMSFLYYSYGGTQSNGVTHGEKSTRARSDRMIELVLLFLYTLMFWLVNLKMSESSFRIYLPHSSALVWLDRSTVAPPISHLWANTSNMEKLCSQIPEPQLSKICLECTNMLVSPPRKRPIQTLSWKLFEFRLLPYPLIKFAIPVPGCVISGPVRERN